MNSLYDEMLIALHGVWNRRWLALGVAWGVCMLGWLAVSFIPNSYESKARVFVQTQSVLQNKIGITPIEQQKNLDAIRQTLASAVNLEKVVRGTDLAGTVSNDKEVTGKVNMLREKIKVVAQQDNLFEITATMSDGSLSDRANARLSTQVVQKLIDIFQEANISGERDETRQGVAFLDQQIAMRAKQLAEAERQKVEFAQRFAGVLPGAGSIGQRMDAARLELNQIESQLMGAQSALAAMNAQLAGTPANLTTPGTGGGNPALAAAQQELASARARGWTSSHPDVIALQRQIVALRAQGNSGGTAGSSTPNPAYQTLRSMQAERAATVQGLQARKAQIQADLNAMASRQSAEPGVVSQQENLDRAAAALKAQYDKLLADRNEVALRGDVQSETRGVTFRVIDPPSVPTAPAKPNRPLLLVGVLIAGIFAGIGTAFALCQLHSTFATSAKLEKLSGLPVIGSVTETLNAGQLAERKRKRRIFSTAGGALVVACVLLIVVEFVQRSMA